MIFISFCWDLGASVVKASPWDTMFWLAQYKTEPYPLTDIAVALWCPVLDTVPPFLDG